MGWKFFFPKSESGRLALSINNGKETGNPWLAALLNHTSKASSTSGSFSGRWRFTSLKANLFECRLAASDRVDFTFSKSFGRVNLGTSSSLAKTLSGVFFGPDFTLSRMLIFLLHVIECSLSDRAHVEPWCRELQMIPMWSIFEQCLRAPIECPTFHAHWSQWEHAKIVLVVWRPLKIW